MPDSASQVTQLLAAWRNGDPEAPRQLMPLVYDRLRRIARHGIAPITVKREWSKARAWLYNELRTEDRGGT